MLHRLPRPKLSLVRLAALLLTAAFAAAAGIIGWNILQDNRAAAASPMVFTGYVDVTATPTFAFEEPRSEDAKSVALSFVVADPQEPCRPMWGAAYSLDQAGSDLELDRRIARLRQLGGKVAVSFGGAANDELAISCTDPALLKNAYQSVVERYDLATIDLDLEGEALADGAAAARRAGAIAALQQDRRAAGKDLTVWLTLPVAPHGLTDAGTDAVRVMLSAGVDLAGVNIMTMDYGESKAPEQSMLQASTAAAEATHGQLVSLYTEAHQDLGSQTVWRKMGLTPMIGQNDVLAESFSIADAAGLNAFARDKGIGRLSMWSLNRDLTCSPNYPDVTVVSNSCSGVAQGDVQFSQALGQGRMETPGAPVVRPSAESGAQATAPVDDPATSPYPIWLSGATYVAGDKIVWQRNVYEAKWWTRRDVPNEPVPPGSTTPWKLVGPVLPGDKPRPEPVVPAGTYPEWSATTIYVKGDRVLFDGHIYESKWWTQAYSPDMTAQMSDESPWVKLKAEDVEAILAAQAG